ncbi:unnamed protein product, partial [Meganyctiphanes norvegica]
MSTPTLYYWDIRGLGQHIRLLLEYTGTEFQDTHPKNWSGDKFKLGLDFPNLPYYVDGDVKLTQSNAIMRHIARKHNMCGKTDKERDQCDMVEGFAMDMRMDWGFMCYVNHMKDNYDLDKEKSQYLKDKLPVKLKQLSEFLGEREWFIGESVTYVDPIIYELLSINLVLSNTCLKDFKNLQNFHDRFEALEPIKGYMASDRYKKRSINSPVAAMLGKIREL